MNRLLTIILCMSIVLLPSWSIGQSFSADEGEASHSAEETNTSCESHCADEAQSAPHEQSSNRCPGKSCHDAGACSHGCGPSKTTSAAPLHIKFHDALGHAFPLDNGVALVECSAAFAQQRFEEVDSPPPRS